MILRTLPMEIPLSHRKCETGYEVGGVAVGEELPSEYGQAGDHPDSDFRLIWHWRQSLRATRSQAPESTMSRS